LNHSGAFFLLNAIAVFISIHSNLAFAVLLMVVGGRLLVLLDIVPHLRWSWVAAAPAVVHRPASYWPKNWLHAQSLQVSRIQIPLVML
jgi:hypothetical protein